MRVLAQAGRCALFVALVVSCASVFAAEREAKVVQIGLTLLGNPKVRRELGLNRSQTDLIEREFKAYAAATERMFPNDMTRAQVAANMPRLRSLQDGVSARVLGALSPAQTARFRELVLQGEGIWAVLIPEVTRELGLTGAQCKKIRGIRSAFGDKVEALKRKREVEVRAIPAPRNTNDKVAIEAYRKTVLAIVRPDERNIKAWGHGAVKKATSVLTPRQRAAWNRMQGPKFHPR